MECFTRTKRFISRFKTLFVRVFRHLSQDSISDYLGLTGDSKRRSMTRYEKGDRNPKDERVKKLAYLFNVSFNSLKKYDC